MNRTSRAAIAQETVEIANRGWYETPAGKRVDISAAMDRCLSGTALYRPGELDRLPPRTGHPAGLHAAFEVANETSLAAARRLVVERGCSATMCLNFASAKNAGGGFLGGSQAQEESLARASGLYRSLLTQDEYYAANRACGTCLYTDHMIFSPAVPVFRDDEGQLLEEPYCLDIVTAPAVNKGAILKNEPQRAHDIGPTMRGRIENLLRLAADRGCEHLILGAWGCGVFRNDPEEVASLFAFVLGGEPFRNRFRTIVFAVLDSAPDERTIGPFRRIWGS
ncbi:MAG TPA: TIGR02452 family protein [Pirellulaceae bacterium]|nr:TIGR02452 family protein [Pirellulaceae bacterium]